MQILNSFPAPSRTAGSTLNSQSSAEAKTPRSKEPIETWRVEGETYSSTADLLARCKATNARALRTTREFPEVPSNKWHAALAASVVGAGVGLVLGAMVAVPLSWFGENPYQIAGWFAGGGALMQGAVQLFAGDEPRDEHLSGDVVRHGETMYFYPNGIVEHEIALKAGHTDGT